MLLTCDKCLRGWTWLFRKVLATAKRTCRLHVWLCHVSGRLAQQQTSFANVGRALTNTLTPCMSPGICPTSGSYCHPLLPTRMLETRGL